MRRYRLFLPSFGVEPELGFIHAHSLAEAMNMACCIVREEYMPYLWVERA